MLFPRTQYLQLQQEYFDVALSFELFQRAFGELDILHEEQIVDDTLGGYEMLVLFDVALLPEDTAGHIASFVRKGGTVIADCLPQLGRLREPMDTLLGVFGVREGATGRITRSGHWVPYRTREAVWVMRPDDAPDESVFTTDTLRGEALGASLDLTLISPRPCEPTDGEVLLRTGSGAPALVRRRTGKGGAYLLGFCTQDTYFHAWQQDDAEARSQLRSLFAALADDAGVRPHVRSSNPDIEASVRANEREAFLFLINHESTEPTAKVWLADLEFKIAKMLNLDTGREVAFTPAPDGGVSLDTQVPLGETRILRVSP